MEQAAFQPNNTVPSTGLSPDKMLLARGFSYADAHRARLGVNYQQIPVNRPHSAVRSYSKDGAMRIDNVTDPVYYPNSFDAAPAADELTYAEQAVWAADGEMVRAASTLHAEDDDVGQAYSLVNGVMDDAARERLIDTVSGLLAGLRREEVRQRAFAYWHAIDKAVGDRIEAAALAKRRR
jgi:catalase